MITILLLFCRFLVEQFVGRHASILQKSELLLTVITALERAKSLNTITILQSPATKSRLDLFEEAFHLEFGPPTFGSSSSSQLNSHLVRSVYFPLIQLSPYPSESLSLCF